MKYAYAYFCEYDSNRHFSNVSPQIREELDRSHYIWQFFHLNAAENEGKD